MSSKKSGILLFSLLALYFMFAPSLLYAQSEIIKKEELNNLGKMGAGGQVYPVKSRTVTTGSPYLSKDFVKGFMMINKSTKSNDMFLRYDLYHDVVQFIRHDKVLASSPKKIYGFNIYTKDGDIKFRNGFETELKSITPHTLLRIAYKGKIKLLVKHSVSLNEDLASYSSATKKNKYTQSKTYYLVTKDGTFHEIDDVKADILSILKDRDHNIRDYAASNSLNFNNEEDLIKILKFNDNS